MISSKLYLPENHCSLRREAWSEEKARTEIHNIVSDTELTFDSKTFWPVHPQENVSQASLTYKTLYSGASGIIWTLQELSKLGFANLTRDYMSFLPSVYENYLERPDTGSRVPSYFMGEVGILLLYWRHFRETFIPDRLFRLIQENISNPTLESLWGNPGTMMGALQMFEWTEELHWKELFLKCTDALLDDWKWNSELGYAIWTQELYGRTTKYLGAGHGMFGNIYPFLRGIKNFSSAQKNVLLEKAADSFVKSAVIENDFANWLAYADDPVVPENFWIQWCHGASGAVTSFSYFPQDKSFEVEKLLLQAGELTWHAGPLSKGIGLCHGTDGNAYAFLKLYARTGNSKWLDRARAFAMMAIQQAKETREKFGMRRYALWNGDLGLAILLANCIQIDCRLPLLDYM